MFVRVIADAVVSRLLLVIPILMVGTVVSVLLVRPSARRALSLTRECAMNIWPSRI
ncbi:UNVERIFIED_ORG: hypothetical protein GGI57_005821 [Rhizobium aethiopicum]|nr:hypothetical protein AMK05_PC00051 [Rhizobium sp. N324]ANM19953.1 hypothetical protein AMK06_PC100041 [Rhizobium sp. N541]ANM26338.1 hypothetical protein AMK07_PC100041 [Rhizobium sp. N941]OYD00600.1 hypothetical protein AMK08_PC00051 [Rhizobium sp. N4311]